MCVCVCVHPRVFIVCVCVRLARGTAEPASGPPGANQAGQRGRQPASSGGVYRQRWWRPHRGSCCSTCSCVSSAAPTSTVRAQCVCVCLTGRHAALANAAEAPRTCRGGSWREWPLGCFHLRRERGQRTAAREIIRRSSLVRLLH